MRRVLVLAVLLAAAALSGGVGHSRAAFVERSDQAAQAFLTSAAFNGVAVTLSDPGTPRRATVPLTATASSDRPLASVTFQRSPAGAGTWTTICAPTAAPYACGWDSTGVADGLYDLRATALDGSGYSRTSTVSSRRIDNTAPMVAVTDPGSPLTGTVTVGAGASDAGTGIASVAIAYRPAGGSNWTTICTDIGAPYSCSWPTPALPDGAYDLRALATDGAGSTATSTVSARIVDNTAPTVSLIDDGAPKSGTVVLQTSTGDGDGSGVTSVHYQYRPSGGGAWYDACTVPSSPFSCTVSTTSVPDGLYDARAIASDGAGLSTTSGTLTVQIDNTPPGSAAMTTPGSPISGTITLDGTATDAVGLSAMRFEYRTAGSSGAWSVACTDAAPASPFSCAWDSASTADGSYELRSVATDTAGNATTSAVTAARTVDNTGPVVTASSPAQVRGAANTVGATASDASGVASVVLRYRPAGGGAYTTICTDSGSPYSCSWNVSGLADGAYDVVAVATDTRGFSTTSTVATTAVNNTGPTGTDVQGTNGGVNDRLDAGDTVRLTYSTTMRPQSILAGWSGTSTAIRVRVADTGSADSMTFYDASNTTPLALLATGTSLALGADYVSQSSLFNATIVRSGSTIRVTIGTLISGTVRSSASGNAPMTWQTNAAATDPSGRPVYATTVTETGSADVDF